MVREAMAPPVPGARQRMSYEEWLTWAPDGFLSEWIDGEGVIYGPAGDRHQWIAAFLYQLLSRFATLHDLGGIAMIAPFEVRLVAGRVSREPDVLYLRPEHGERWTAKRLEGGADLAVEHVSDDSVRRDRVEKRAQYEAAGISEYVLIEAREQRTGLEVLRLDDTGRYQAVQLDDDGRAHLVTLAGLWLDPAWFGVDGPPDVERTLMAVSPDAYFAWVDAERRTLGR